MKKQSLKLSFCLLMVLGLSLGAGAQDFGWMQPGVRVWYFGGTGGLTTSNAVEAYLIKVIASGNVQYVRHSALEFWTSPRPVENLIEPVNKGSFWIHPGVLQTIAPGDYWLDQEILTVTHLNFTYATFGEAGMRYSLLPAKALFDVQAEREIVKITFTIPGTYSIGRAFFDAETGLVLCRDMIFEGYTVFFILGEINYDFAQHAAFAEDAGPHCGFKSRVAENALPGVGGHAGGLVDIQSGVETRYVNKIEMWVMSTDSGPYGVNMATENYYFDGNVPIVRRINHDQAGDYPPEEWNPFGQYLPWWLPPTVTQGSAFSAFSLALSTINVYDVPMSKTADQPLTYTATQNPQRFFFCTLWFDNYGYLTQFSAKDPPIGMDIDADSIFGNGTTVDGLSYYLNTMGQATPAIRKDDLVGTWDGQGVFYRNSETGKWIKLGSPANLIAAGDLGGDGIDELIGVFPTAAGVWVRSSSLGTWTKFASASAKHIASADMNGDGRDDLLATWDGVGIYYRNSVSGLWIKMASPANLITAGDLGGDSTDDLICVFPSPAGVWVRYSETAKWVKLSTPSAKDMACGDMNGDGREDFVATWDGLGVFYRNSVSGAWVKMASPADQVACGDLDGDGKDDLIGLWPASGGVFVKYSKTGTWAKLSSPARDMATGLMRGGVWGSSQFGFIPLDMPIGGYAEGPGNLASFKDKSEEGPGGWRFAAQEEKSLLPQETTEALAAPGPGDPGFQYLEENNLFPQEQEPVIQEKKEKDDTKGKNRNRLK